jgi:mRNA interferase RelE/StbE
MTAAPRYQVLWTATALEMLEAVGDRRVQQSIFDASRRLEFDAEKQGKPLREGLFGFRSLRAVGQRHRLIYSIEAAARRVHIVAAGLRREGSRDDIYELAQKLVRLGLVPPETRARAGVTRRRPKKRK